MGPQSDRNALVRLVIAGLRNREVGNAVIVGSAGSAAKPGIEAVNRGFDNTVAADIADVDRAGESQEQCARTWYPMKTAVLPGSRGPLPKLLSSCASRQPAGVYMVVARL
jgi:hypothetical protein